MRLRLLIAACATALSLALPAQALADQGHLSAHEQAVLHGIAADTWKFYAADVDPNTHLPLDNLGPGTIRGTYTSAANIGVYMWAVVAAHDLGLIDRGKADSLLTATLNEVSASIATTAFCSSGTTPRTATCCSTRGRATASRWAERRTTARLSRRSITAGTPRG